MNNSIVYYYIGNVRTEFNLWLGCATKLCKAYKKNKQVCHIKPESEVFPIGNGLYECKHCHERPRPAAQGMYWHIRDQYPDLSFDASLSEQEVQELHEHLAALREFPQVLDQDQPPQT